MDIKERYKEIKARNEEIKTEIYSQYLKQTPGIQNRLLTASEYNNKKKKMTFLQPTAQTPKSSSDYKKTNFEVLAQEIHPLDQIEFHKQAGEMIYSTMTTKAMSVQKLQNTLANIIDQLKLEKSSSEEKNNRIKSLEELVIEVGNEPKNV